MSNEAAVSLLDEEEQHPRHDQKEMVEDVRATAKETLLESGRWSGRTRLDSCTKEFGTASRLSMVDLNRCLGRISASSRRFLVLEIAWSFFLLRG